MKKIAVLVSLLIFIAVVVASCTKQGTAAEDSPTGAYKRLYAAVKSKNSEAIKAQMTKKIWEGRPGL